MNLAFASETDSDRLGKYFQSHPIPGLIDLSINRQGHFFDQYRLQSNQFDTLILTDHNGEIQGMASFVFREALINGERGTIAYATDLRISPTRKAILGWSQHFLPILNDVVQKRGCQYVFSVLSTADRRIYNTFVRPRVLHGNKPRYHLFRRFQAITIHGYYPFAPKPIGTIDIRSAEREDIDPLLDYLRKNNSKRPLQFIYDETLLNYRLEHWHGLKLSDFRIAFDRKKNIVGLVVPWCADAVHQYIPQAFHGMAQTVKTGVAFASWLRWTRKFSSIGKPFRFEYLTMLNAKNPDILYALIHDAFVRSKRDFLVYLHFVDDIMTLPSRWMITSKLPFALYTVLPPGKAPPLSFQPRPLASSPEFELPLI